MGGIPARAVCVACSLQRLCKLVVLRQVEGRKVGRKAEHAVEKPEDQPVRDGERWFVWVCVVQLFWPLKCAPSECAANASSWGSDFPA